MDHLDRLRPRAFVSQTGALVFVIASGRPVYRVERGQSSLRQASALHSFVYAANMYGQGGGAKSIRR